MSFFKTTRILGLLKNRLGHVFSKKDITSFSTFCIHSTGNGDKVAIHYEVLIWFREIPFPLNS